MIGPTGTTRSASGPPPSACAITLQQRAAGVSPRGRSTVETSRACARSDGAARPGRGLRGCGGASGSIAARGFTTIELLVAVALLAVTVVAVSEIFDISSEAASRTAAHAEVMGASASLQRRVTDLLSKIEPGLLIIESPAPTGARADVPGGPKYYRLRHDRLVFIASGSPGEFQSFTDPTRGTPDDPPAIPNWTSEPAGSSHALIYFGPGIPLSDGGEPRRPRPFDNEAYSLSGSEWIFAHRAILFVLDDPSTPGWNPPGMGVFTAPGGMLDGGNLYGAYKLAKMDAVVSDANTRADAAAIIEAIQGKSLSTDLLTANPSIAALWDANLCPRIVTLADPAKLDYYARSGFSFQPRLTDFRIEWTDGRRVDPLGPDGVAATGDEDARTRWFGLRPDPNAAPDLSAPNNLDYVAVLRQNAFSGDSTPAEDDAFGTSTNAVNRIEWATDVSGGSDPFGAYRAIWRGDTWQFRPKALRLTYRLYDAGRRLKHTTEIDLDEDGDPDPDGAAAYNVMRYGQEFSIVIPIP